MRFNSMLYTCIVYACLLLSTIASANNSTPEFLNAVELSQAEKRMSEMEETARKYVFKVVMIREGGFSGGTGFILKNTKVGPIVITNEHVCGSSKLGILIQGDTLFPTIPLKVNQRVDLCLVALRIDKIAADSGFELADDSEAPKPGETLYTYGHPALGAFTSMYGEYLRELDIRFFGQDPKIPPKRCGEFTAKIRGGQSGSPVLNDKMHVVGVAVGSGTTSVFIPLKSLRAFVTAIEKTSGR